MARRWLRVVNQFVLCRQRDAIQATPKTPCPPFPSVSSVRLFLQLRYWLTTPFYLDGEHGMGLVRPAFMETNQFSFLHLDLWMPGARRVRVGFISHIPPDGDL